MTKVTIEVEEALAPLASALNVIEVGTHIEAFPGDRIVVYAGRTAIDVDTPARIPRPLAIAGPKRHEPEPQPKPKRSRRLNDKQLVRRQKIDRAVSAFLSHSPNLTVGQIERGTGLHSMHYRLRDMVRRGVLVMDASSQPLRYAVNPTPPAEPSAVPRAEPLRQSRDDTAKTDECVMQALAQHSGPVPVAEIVRLTEIPRSRLNWVLKRLRGKNAVAMHTEEGASTATRFQYSVLANT